MKPREARRKVVIPARLRAGGPVVDVLIRNTSSRGLMVNGAPLPARGTYVELLRPGLAIVGRIVWAADGRCGIHARERIDLAVLTGAASPSVDDGGTPLPSSPPKSSAADRFRFCSALMQFLALVLFGTAAAIGLGMVVHDALALPAATVASQLRGR